jgi:hypothetical protein
MRCFWRVLVITLAAVLALPASPDSAAGIRGPLLGYLWQESSPALRPLWGIPGAALVGTPVQISSILRAAEIAPGQDYAVAIDRDSGEVVVAGLRSGPKVTLVAGAYPDPSRIVFSPTGTAAALFYAERGLVQLLMGLSSIPVIVTSLDLTLAPGAVTALAVNDGGDLLLAGTSQGDFGSVYLLGRETARRLAGASHVAGLAFLENSGDALVVDDVRREVLLLLDAAGPAEIRTLAGAQDGLERPVAAAGSGTQIVVADAGANRLVLLDTAGGVPTLLSCDCSVTGLHRLRSEAVYRITAGSAPIPYLLDATGPEPRVLFVAADPSERTAPPPARSRSR